MWVHLIVRLARCVCYNVLLCVGLNLYIHLGIRIMLRTTSITLGEHQKVFIETLVKSGRYTSTSEVVRDALRKLEESQGSEWLASLLIEGEKGEAKAWDDDALMKHIKQEAAKRGNI